jgi:hypothetical protein
MWNAWEKKVYTVLMGNPEERENLKDRSVDVRMELKWILGKLGGACRVDPAGSG